MAWWRREVLSRVMALLMIGGGSFWLWGIAKAIKWIWSQGPFSEFELYKIGLTVAVVFWVIPFSVMIGGFLIMLVRGEVWFDGLEKRAR